MNGEEKQSRYIQKIEIIGIFNRFDIILDDLQPGINILCGDNGSGKTTVLHILVNLLAGDYGRFISIDFNRIKIIFNDDSFVEIYKSRVNNLILRRSDFDRELEIFDGLKDQDIETNERKIEAANKRALRFEALLSVAYFPAFRSMIEAWDLLRNDELNNYDPPASWNQSESWEENITALARKLFGGFIPSLNYLSPAQIEKELFEIFRKAKKKVIHHNQEVLSKSFKNVFTSFDNLEMDDLEAVSQNILQEIKRLAKEIAMHPLQGDINFIEGLEEKVDIFFSTTQANKASSMAFVLNTLKTYKNSLQEIVDFQDKAYEPISNYLESVNNSITKKRIAINLDASVESKFLRLLHPDGTEFGGIQCLSSGEKQIFALMYAVTHVSSKKLILIDEPEISIHIDKQVELLKKLSGLASDKQIIVCTHSPTIAGEEIDRLKEVDLLETDIKKWCCLRDDRPNNGIKYQDEKESSRISIDKEDYGIYDEEISGNKE